jgi:uncharacterized membrane protein (UPF0127 family)
MQATLFFFFLVIACLGMGPCASPPEVRIHTAVGEEISITVELANTPEKRGLGLMYRKELEPGKGMFFLFPSEQPLTFWMKDTPLSLDLVFINRDGRVVNIVKGATPYSEKPLSSERPAQYVLEVPAGFCESRGIGLGDRVEWRL